MRVAGKQDENMAMSLETEFGVRYTTASLFKRMLEELEHTFDFMIHKLETLLSDATPYPALIKSLLNFATIETENFNEDLSKLNMAQRSAVLPWDYFGISEDISREVFNVLPELLKRAKHNAPLEAENLLNGIDSLREGLLQSSQWMSAQTSHEIEELFNQWAQRYDKEQEEGLRNYMRFIPVPVEAMRDLKKEIAAKPILAFWDRFCYDIPLMVRKLREAKYKELDLMPLFEYRMKYVALCHLIEKEKQDGASAVMENKNDKAESDDKDVPSPPMEILRQEIDSMLERVEGKGCLTERYDLIQVKAIFAQLFVELSDENTEKIRREILNDLMKMRAQKDYQGEVLKYKPFFAIIGLLHTNKVFQGSNKSLASAFFTRENHKAETVSKYMNYKNILNPVRIKYIESLLK